MLVLPISRLGFGVGLGTMVAVMFAVLIPVTLLALRPKRRDEFDPADFGSETVAPPHPALVSGSEVPRIDLITVMCSRASPTTSLPFALALTAQAAILTHQGSLHESALRVRHLGQTKNMTGKMVVGFSPGRHR
jgi:hypothetical protein